MKDFLSRREKEPQHTQLTEAIHILTPVLYLTHHVHDAERKELEAERTIVLT